MRTTQEAAHCLEQIQEAILHETATVRSPASHLTYHSSKTNTKCKALVEKQGWTHGRCYPMDFGTWKCQCWPTSKDRLISASCRDKMLPKRPDRNNGWSALMVRDSQPTLCCLCHLMMMMLIFYQVFRSNINNFHTVAWLQVFPLNTNSLWFQVISIW